MAPTALPPAGPEVGGSNTAGVGGTTSDPVTSDPVTPEPSVPPEPVSPSPPEDSVPLDAELLSRCIGTDPIVCSIEVPNGNYQVTVELGSETEPGSTRVQAELYRIVVPTASTQAGELRQHTFAVNVREEKHDGYGASGGVLDLRFDGDAPRLHGLGIREAPELPTLFVAGDSTVCDWDPNYANIVSPEERGWAQELSQYLDAGVAVANYADSGETAGAFYNKFFTPAVSALRAGDTVFIQFGHNDQKNQADVDAYKSNLMRYVDAARNAGATPVLFTPVGRRGASLGNPGFAGLDEQVRELAATEDVAWIDLTTLSIEAYGNASDLASWFVDGTHFSETGASNVARVVAYALAASELELAEHVVSDN